MATKQKPIYVCDKCGKEMDKPTVVMADVSNEGASEIIMGDKSFIVGGQDYCGLDCAIEAIRAALSVNG